MGTNETSNVDAASQISKSKQKRIERKKKNEQVKREGLIGSIIGILAIALILGGMIFSVVSSIMKNADEITPNNEFGKYITDGGMVEQVKAAKIVTLPDDYKNITIPLSEVEYTDEEFEEEKRSQVEAHKVLNKESEKVIENGDEIGLDYVGTIDSEEFEGGSTDGQGTSLVIGSGSYIDGFEDQIIGHKTGDNFDINVTFPEDYASADLAGKDAVFNITVNGVYETGEFDDEFVATNLSAYATTVDEYKEYLEKANYEDRVKTYVSNYIDENSTLSKYPKKYLNQLKALKMYSDNSSFQYMNQLYQQMYGMGYGSFEEYMGMTNDEYLDYVDEESKKSELTILALQAIAEKENITVSEDDIKSFVEEVYGEGSYDSTLESYGRPYLAQTALQDKVGNFLIENATIK